MVRNLEKFQIGFAETATKTLFLAGVALAVFLISGFIRFSTLVAGYDDLPMPAGEGIAVLTGGNARIVTGLHLLEKRRAKHMLISGVNPQTSEHTIAKMFSEHSSYISCCVELDHVAKNTVQNAEEIAKWAGRKNFKQIIVVTSNYHMPRALLEVSRALPGIALLPHVVRQQIAVTTAGMNNSGNIKIMVKEYLKTLASSFAF